MSAPMLPIGWPAHGKAPLRLPLSTITRHALVTGTTGWGKSGLLLSLMLGVLRGRHPVNVVLVDLKGETAAELRDRFLPALRGRLGLDPARIVSVAPFSRYGVALNPLAPIPGLAAEVQANLVVGLVGTLVGAGGLGPRMQTVLVQLVRVVMALGGSLLDVLRLLTDEGARAQALHRTQDPGLRHYLSVVFEAEPQSSKQALRARLEWLLLVPEIRRSLCAPGCLRGSDLLEAPLAIVDLGGAPQGFVPLSRFVGGLIFQLLTAAVFSRSVGPQTRPVMLVADEWQELVHSGHEDIERLLSLARFKRVGLWLANQTTSQISTISPALLSSLKTNMALHVAFRPEVSDIQHLVKLLPVTGRRVDPERPDQLLSKTQERDGLLETLAHLPPRHALLGNLVEGRAEVIRTLTLPYQEAADRSAQLAAGVVEAFLQGRLGVPYAELNPVEVLVGEPDRDLSPEGEAPAAAPPQRPRPRRRADRPVLELPS